MDQDIHFCNAPDGVRLAYATSGSGPPLVKAANWLNHLQYDWESPIWRHVFRELSRDHQLVRYDERGAGLSDWEADDVSFDMWVRDLETVVDAAGLDRFALLGISQGGAVSVAYAVRHPERVSHLILLGAWTRGWGRRESPEGVEVREALITLIRAGWGQENPAFRQIWTSRFVPEGTLDQQRWFNELQRVTTSPANAVRLVQTTRDVDVADLLPRVQARTLVLHCRGDVAVRFEHGRETAGAIPGAQFVALESKNHLLLEDEPAFSAFLHEVRRFLGTKRPIAAAEGHRGLTVTAPASLEVVPGDQLGTYRVESRLGAGGMGVVYKAWDQKLRRSVALKVLVNLDRGEDARRHLLREARHAAALNHPHVCTIYEVAEASGVDFIVMELVTGRPLNALTNAGALPKAQLELLGTQIADALAHAHEAGVIHGDLKSANIVVRDDGHAKVLDFGIARRMDSGTGHAVTQSERSGTMAGTLAYMAPEILKGEAPDARSDVWSLGVLLFEMATGALPFRGTGLDLVAAILRDEPPFPRKGVSPVVVDIIRRCLEKPPERRVTSAADVSKRLRLLESGLGFPTFGGMFDR